MRVSHVLNYFEKQKRLSQEIANSVRNLFKVDNAEPSKHRIEVHRSLLKENWQEFKINEDAIKIAILQLSRRDQADANNNDYFSLDLFSSTKEAYLESLEIMQSHLDRLQEFDHLRLRSRSSSRSTNQENTQSFSQYTTHLPRMEIPKFNGTPSEWIPFKGLFTSMVINNTSLSLVQKLQYLKTSLTGTAASHLDGTTLIAENFQKAWDCLITIYENEHLLVRTALQKFASIKKMSKESGTELENLYTNLLQIYRHLETIGRPVQYWGDPLVFFSAQKLDPETSKVWELHIGSSRTYPTWQNFIDFVRNRMFSLKSYEESHQTNNQPKIARRAIGSHLSTADQSGTLKDRKCILCEESHYISQCSKYSNQTEQQRLNLILKHRLCFNCLGNHRSSACQNTKRCKKCGQKHHSTIHQAVSTKGQTKEALPSQTEPVAQVNHASLYQQPGVGTLLATAKIIVKSSTGKKATARALIDPGSQISFISERLAQQLNLSRKSSTITLHGIGAVNAGRTKGEVSFVISPYFNTSDEKVIKAHVLPKLTSSFSTQRVNMKTLEHLQGLQLADPDFHKAQKIDLIIGADYYTQIIEEGLRKGPPDQPIAQKTFLGWAVIGPSQDNASADSTTGLHVSVNDSLHDLVQKFWEIENVPCNSSLKRSTKDQECEDHFKASHSRDETGRYIVRLPFQESPTLLGNSRISATRMLSRLHNKFQTNPSLKSAYEDFLHEYESLDHMKLVAASSPEPDQSYYLPHHGVLRESSLTTKLRVVFNGSSRTSSGVSLNDLLHTGEKLQIDLIDVLLWFRLRKYVFTSDMEKMYRQIKVHPDDWKYQRILWSMQNSPIQTYELTTVTYGLASAPYLALRTINQLIHDEGHRFPLAIPTLVNGRYVDDIFGGADSPEESQKIVQQISQLLMAGGFPLHKWVSNSPGVLQDIPQGRKITADDVNLPLDTTVHALGISWNPLSDMFLFTTNLKDQISITKRTILSTIAQLFDPVGFLAPVIIRAKILIQELWAYKYGWDDPLPHQVTDKWIQFLHQLPDLSSITIPRWLGFKDETSVELHGFCDASQQAYAAVVYLKVTDTEGNTTVSFVCSKSKVAPLKRMTIPRLELSGSVLLTKLVSHLLNVLKLPNVSIHLWTDSSIVLTWINNHPSKWKEFIHNRVCFIQETLPSATWRFISGKENPSDCATRGLSPDQLSEHSIWWNGPSWIHLSSSLWPSTMQPEFARDLLEERPAQTHISTVSSKSSAYALLDHSSSLTRLLRLTAIWKRYFFRLKKCGKSIIEEPITSQELQQAKLFWVRQVQQEHFSTEISWLLKGRNLLRSSPLVRLTPFIDKDGLLRLGGRLHASLLPPDTKHPLILPKDSLFSNLIISNAHQQTLHGGVQLTLSTIRTEFWILGGRAPIRSFILRCVKCVRYRHQRAQQMMGQAPAINLTPARPFLHSGIDYAGPIILKTTRGRAAKQYKAWIAIFVCFATSAIHIELVTDYTADSFIAAFKRFTSRRGICATLRSDCGTNLKGACKELKQLFTSASSEIGQVAKILANDGTKWSFNPPGAPHFGGKWEAGVKSVKYHLHRVIGESVLTYEEMSTFLTQIEAVLNSRPLSPVTDDSEDLHALTPGHFLTGGPINILPEPSLETIKVSHLSRWQLLQQMFQSFWTRWSKECLQRYQSQSKWNQPSNNIQEGVLVLVIDERYPPSKWPLGRIIKIHPGKDNLVRVVTVKTAVSTYMRPITKLCPLPIQSHIL